MNLYMSESDEKYPEIIEKFHVVSEMKQSDQVLILPGGLGSFYDLFRAIDEKRDVIIYNRDVYFTSVIKNLYDAHEKGNIDEVPAYYADIESELEEIIRMLEEKENGKINDGKTSKLL